MARASCRSLIIRSIESRKGRLDTASGKAIDAHLTNAAGDTIPVRIGVGVDHPFEPPQVDEPEK